MMKTQLLLLRDTENRIVLGASTHFGFLPMLFFSDLDELKTFARNISEFIDQYSVPVPEVYLKAFGDKEDNYGHNIC